MCIFALLKYVTMLLAMKKIQWSNYGQKNANIGPDVAIFVQIKWK